jgi:hypothetical protein
VTEKIGGRYPSAASGVRERPGAAGQ